MKHIFTFLGLGLLLGTAACSNNMEIEEPYDEGLKEIKLTSNITALTRGADLYEQNEFINDQQHVGVTITGASESHNNVKWFSDGLGNLENLGNPIYFAGANTASIYAYQPYNLAWNDVANQSYTFSVQTDQSGKGYANSDLLWASATSDKSAPAVILNFKHLLSKVNVILTNDEGIDMETADISLTGVETSAEFQTGVVTSLTGNIADVIAGKSTSKATAIIVPQIIEAGTPFVTITLNGKNYTYNMKVTKALLSGKMYNISLKLVGTELILDKANVNPWENGDSDESPETPGEVTHDGAINDYLSFTAQENNCRVMYSNYGGNVPDMKYSMDKLLWQTWAANEILTLHEGDIIYIKGDNSDGFSHSETKYSKFTTSGLVATDGNIMSLIYSDDFKGKMTIPCNGCFWGLFQNTTITSAPKLPASTLTPLCYEKMFSNCTNLSTAPKLPATTLDSWCYSNMFSDCNALTIAPELPADTVKSCSYYKMFNGCTKLKDAPKLPATKLATRCYDSMFAQCSELETAPNLPAKSLAPNCYHYMFSGCSNLETVPELPATSLEAGCYSGMFYSCKKLSIVKAAFISVPSADCVNYWLSGTATNGIFYRNPNSFWSTNAEAGIPSGWTIQTY